MDEGARKIGVAGLPPMGCLPIVITLFSEDAVLDRGCIDYFSSVGRTYNSMLQSGLNIMQFNNAHQGGRITYFDTYSPLYDVVAGHKYGKFISFYRDNQASLFYIINHLPYHVCVCFQGSKKFSLDVVGLAY